MTGEAWLALVGGMIAGGLIAALWVPLIQRRARIRRLRESRRAMVEFFTAAMADRARISSARPTMIGFETCRVYWGSHGCMLPRRHDGDCICACAMEPDEPGVSNVGAPPYYGEGETWFYGEDAADRGLPMINNEGDQP